MSLIIREATDADYPALARLQTEVNPAHPITAERLQHEHAWLAERDGEAVGFAMILQIPGMFHPDRYNVQVGVRPHCGRQGLGAALADRL